MTQMNEKDPGILLVLSGPSGVGKGTIVRELKRRGAPVFYSVSATTRAPREGEIDGTDYYFITRGRFEEMLGRDEFLEHAQYVDNYYGTPMAPVLGQISEGVDVLLEIEVLGAEQVRRHFPEAVHVFLLPPSMEELESRLRGRGTESEESVSKRLRQARDECLLAPTFDYVVCNDDVERAVDCLLAILTAEKCRPARRAPRCGPYAACTPIRHP